jgi:serine/threonine protein kinase
MVHRNLSTRSLYLSNKNQGKDHFHHQKNQSLAHHHHHHHDKIPELIVGDYGVMTVMKDARTKTRVLPGTFDYTAPEIINYESYDFKSDIWNIGTILLDICTTTLYDVRKNVTF